MQIHHHGAVNGVTGSCHELALNTGPGILIDCGLFQGDEQRHADDNELALAINFPIEHIVALVVTHVHIDHVGRIPYLLAAGFKGPIYCSIPSALLLPLVLEDALKIGFTRNKRLINQFMQQLQRQLRPLAYKSWQPVAGVEASLAIRLQPAGHILGSAYVQCRVSEQGASNKVDVLFSGDLGAPYSPLLSAPRAPYGSDILVIESTYGDRRHANRRRRRQQLQQIIERAVSDQGVVLIPAFSIGRTQELLYELETIIHQADSTSSWAQLEVLLDSPLAAKFTNAYRQLKPYWDKEAHRHLKQGRHPLNFEQLYTVDSHQQHLDTLDYLQRRNKPCIVIAASGMCAGGRIVNYLKAFVADERTDILLVGYQAQGTPGRALQQYGPQHGYVQLDGERYTINARVHSLSGYSAHADQQDLLNFVKRMRNPPSQIRVIHGDAQAKQCLQQKLQQLCPAARVWIPEA